MSVAGSAVSQSRCRRPGADRGHDRGRSPREQKLLTLYRIWRVRVVGCVPILAVVRVVVEGLKGLGGGGEGATKHSTRWRLFGFGRHGLLRPLPLIQGLLKANFRNSCSEIPPSGTPLWLGTRSNTHVEEQYLIFSFARPFSPLSGFNHGSSAINVIDRRGAVEQLDLHMIGTANTPTFQ